MGKEPSKSRLQGNKKKRKKEKKPHTEFLKNIIGKRKKTAFKNSDMAFQNEKKVM